MDEPEVVVLSDPASLAEEAALRFAETAVGAVAAHGRFTVALAGGSTPKALYRRLAARPFRDQVDWSRTLVFFGDERCVSPDDRDSNYGVAREALLDRVPLSTENVFPMWCGPDRSLDEAAAEYSRVLAEHFGLAEDGARPEFDLILLGIGEDGHTASLFPGMPAVEVQDRLVVGSIVPAGVSPAVPRLTLTLPVLNNASRILFLVEGKRKAEAVRQVIEGGAAGGLPAARVQPQNGTLTWLLDASAAGGLA